MNSEAQIASDDDMTSDPIVDGHIGFEPAGDRHVPMLAEWMARPHWREWWGDPATELARIREMIDGRDTTRPFIFHVAGMPAGYIQYWSIGDYQTAAWVADHPWLATLPPETIGIDLSIASEDNLSRGIGSAVLRAFVADRVREGHRAIIIDPDPANRRAVRAYEKAGFRAIETVTGRDGDTLLMRFDLSVLENA